MEEATVIKFERLPPPLPSLSTPTPTPLQQQVEIIRGKQAADGGVSVVVVAEKWINGVDCLLYTSPSPRDGLLSRMPSSA